MLRLRISFSESECPLVGCRAFEDLEASKSSSSSSMDIVVAAVELERWENFIRLPSAVSVVCDVCVWIDERLVVDFVRLWPLIEPPKKSPMADPGRELKRLREIASRPNIATRDLAVGVDGRESRPVRNWNSPNWWTWNMVIKKVPRNWRSGRTGLYYS